MRVPLAVMAGGARGVVPLHHAAAAARALQLLLLLSPGAVRAQFGSFCSLEPRGCYRDCWDPATKAFTTPPTPATLRTLPFGVDGCCQTGQDPPGGCTGECGAKLCANIATTGLAGMCPASGATCTPCTPGSMTLEVCAGHCLGLGYTFSGVEYRDQCFCGHFIAPFALAVGGPDTEGLPSHWWPRTGHSAPPPSNSKWREFKVDRGEGAAD